MELTRDVISVLAVRECVQTCTAHVQATDSRCTEVFHEHDQFCAWHGATSNKSVAVSRLISRHSNVRDFRDGLQIMKVRHREFTFSRTVVH